MRIIAGKHRGRPLLAPAGQTTRPTAARVREALFGILGDISGVTALDLCAGSGALGFEALSRGAEHVVFVDSDRAATDTIRKNIQALKAEAQTSVLPIRLERSKQALLEKAPFGLVLCDPPWPHAQPISERVLELLVAPLITRETTVVIGHRADRPLATPKPPWVKLETRRWGDSAISWFEYRPEQSSPKAASENNQAEPSEDGA